MELTEETAKKLIEALEGFDDSVGVFTTAVEKGIGITAGTSDTINNLIKELKSFNEIQSKEKG
ncbi:MAG: hypothetical protein RIE86_12780 [Imperialibacter sp.]|uniref:hypothetical protein n=1 Tax=Imperialibacter sp. TaxID=2038411 RepID=UPI0032EFE324